MMIKGLVDSNILIYCLTGDEPKKKILSLDLVHELALNSQLVFSVQNFAETARVILEKSKKNHGSEELMRDLATYAKKSLILSYSDKTVLLAIDISSKYKLHFFDALIAATMKENGIKVIYTENTKDFKNLPFIRAINPFN